MLNELRAHIVTSLGAGIGGRMYPEILPQMPTLPAITYQVVSEWRRPTLHGTDGLPRVRVQMDCWANTSLEARSVADAVREAIDGFAGLMGGSPGADISGIFAANSFSSYDPDAKMYRVSRDYMIWARD